MIKVYISKWIKFNVHNKSDKVLDESYIQPDLIEEDVIEDIEHKINEVQKLEPNNYQHVTIPSVGKELALSMQGNSLESSLESNQVSKFLEGIQTFSKSLLLGSSQSFYNQQCDLFCEIFKVDKQYFPSVYKLTKE